MKRDPESSTPAMHWQHTTAPCGPVNLCTTCSPMSPYNDMPMIPYKSIAPLQTPCSPRFPSTSPRCPHASHHDPPTLCHCNPTQARDPLVWVATSHGSRASLKKLWKEIIGRMMEITKIIHEENGKTHEAGLDLILRSCGTLACEGQVMLRPAC